MSHAARTLILAVAILAAWQAPAMASTVSVSAPNLTYTANSGETNNLTISQSGANFIVHDSGAVIVPGTGCSLIGPNDATCVVAGVTMLSIGLDDNNDTATNQTGVDSSIDGGAGADTLNGGSGSDTLTGGAGHDIVNAGAGADQIMIRDGAADDADCGASDGATDVVTTDDPGVDTLTNCSGDTIDTNDTQPPDTSISGGPSGLTNDATPTFSFGSTESSTFECSIDQGTVNFTACAGPGPSFSGSDTPGTPLADGSWTFRVRAKDASNNTDPTPATRAFTVDTQAPDTQIDSGPSGVVADNDVQFTYSANEAASFECSLDGASFSSCPAAGRGYSNLPDGSHSFQVRATDAAANTDPTPAARQFTVDAGAPATRIDSGPFVLTGPNVAFTYSANEPSTFECSLDGSAFESCPASGKSYSALPQGLHFFQVRARDATGNPDPNPPVWAFVVDTSPPQTFISGGPKKITRNRTPTFYFRTNEEGAVTVCSLDGSPYALCADSLTTPRLKRGSHSFVVTSVDLAGNVDPTPAIRHFRVR